MTSSVLYLFLVANIPGQDYAYWKNFNLFPSVPPSTNKYELRVQRISTILFLVLSILILIAIPLVYIKFVMGTNTTSTVRVNSPSLNVYLELYSMYPQSLTCACTQVSINYATFVHVEYTLHEVCTSIFVTDDWIFRLAMGNGATFYGDDFRVTSSHAFQALRTFCELVNATILDSLLRFYSSQYVGISVTPPELFQIQIESMIDQFRSTTANSFLLSLWMIRGTTQANSLFSGLQTNYRLYGGGDSNNVIIAAKNYNDCSCDLSAKCIQQSSIYNYTNGRKLFDVPGFYTGCNVIESLLQSTLQCFYHQTCIDELQTYLSSSPALVSALDSSSSSRYFENSTIKNLLDYLMVEVWSLTTMYSKYYEQCQPAQCTYTIEPVERKRDVIYIVIIMFFIVGGPIPVLKLVISMLTKIIAYCIRKSTRQVIPETLIMHT